MEKDIYELMTKMYSEILDIKSEVQTTNKRLDALEKEVSKNTITLENVDEKLKILAEVQSSFSEQLDRAKDKDGKTLGERLEIIEMAVTSSSKRISHMETSLGVVKNKVGTHDLDIEIINKSIGH